VVLKNASSGAAFFKIRIQEVSENERRRRGRSKQEVCDCSGESSQTHTKRDCIRAPVIRILQEFFYRFRIIASERIRNVVSDSKIASSAEQFLSKLPWMAI